jgi:RHS repeat-associated protein
VDRVTQRTLSFNAIGGSGTSTPEVTTYTWDNASRLSAQATVFGPPGSQTEHRTEYTFDAANRLASRKSVLGSTGSPLTQRYSFDAVDRLSRIQYLQAEGTASEQLLEQIDYSYDARGQRTAKTTLNNHGSGTAETAMQATYDAANRMQSITLALSNGTGNGTGTGTGTGTTSQTYALGYDAEGNLTSKQNTANASDKTVYTWDAQNKLTQISQSGAQGTVSAAFSYDSFGRRVQSSIQLGTSPAQTVQYLYEGAQALGEIRNQALSHRLLTGLSLDETIARVALFTSGPSSGSGAADPANSRSYLTDALNSVIAQHNAASTGGIANSYGYSPYGQSTTVGPDATGNMNQYTSRENDATGLLYYRARYYDPVLKRFISSDPIGLAGGMNMYAYVEGDPVRFSDPEGLRPVTRGTYYPKGPAISGPPKMAENGGWASPRNLMNQFTNLPNPAPQLPPGGYVGVNYPWSMPNLKRICIQCISNNSGLLDPPNPGGQCPKPPRSYDGPSMSAPGNCTCVKFAYIDGGGN